MEKVNGKSTNINKLSAVVLDSGEQDSGTTILEEEALDTRRKDGRIIWRRG
jgi:hypothetical protein